MIKFSDDLSSMRYYIGKIDIGHYLVVTQFVGQMVSTGSVL